MSFLKGVLSSIGTGQPASPSAPSTKPSTPSNKPNVGRSLAINGVTPTQSLKRKAESDIGSVATKAPRTEGLKNGTSHYAGTAKPTGTPPVSRPTSRPSSTGPETLPYRGTAKSGPSAVTTNVSKPVAKPFVASTAASSGAVKPTSRPTTPATGAAPAPKPGSYQAMMARAKATAATLPVVGSITHKQTEKITKKELLARKEEIKKQQISSKNKPTALNSRLGKTESKSNDVPKATKKPGEPAYQGTMRAKPTEPSYTGTARSGPSTKPRKSAYAANGRLSEKARGPSYASYSEDEGEDYASDASSDMEAGAFDVDQEEQLSLRVARKEDEEALREENELKRQKKLRMEKLAAAAAARKKRY